MECDYLIVGAGSAGCVLAARLSENPDCSVMLLEAGGPDTNRALGIPAAFATLFRGPDDWGFETAAEPAMHQRRMFHPRGKTLGGSSAINAMIWTPGAAADYDRWPGLGCPGWDGSVMQRAAARIPMQPSRLTRPNPVSRAFVAAGEALGLRRNDGFGAESGAGVGFFDLSIDRGRRRSAATAYLAPVRARANLTVETGARVHRVLFEGTRAVGVRLADTRGVRECRARRGVILAAGAIGSPHLLLLSGVGGADSLRRLSIPVLADLPGVGEHLEDHLASGILFRCRESVTYEKAASLGNLIRYLLTRGGPLASNIAEAGAFFRISPGSGLPDIELIAAPVAFVDHGFRTFEGPHFSVAAVLLQPRSRGRVTLASADPEAAPIIAPNYLSDPADLPMLIEGLRQARRVVAAPALERWRGDEVLPGPATESDAALGEHVRQLGETLYHPVGTCRMGSDAMAVVDPALRVRGVDRLWVVDASVMPVIPAGHTNAPTMALAERAVELIRSG